MFYIAAGRLIHRWNRRSHGRPKQEQEITRRQRLYHKRVLLRNANWIHLAAASDPLLPQGAPYLPQDAQH